MPWRSPNFDFRSHDWELAAKNVDNLDPGRVNCQTRAGAPRARYMIFLRHFPIAQFNSMHASSASCCWCVRARGVRTVWLIIFVARCMAKASKISDSDSRGSADSSINPAKTPRYGKSTVLHRKFSAIAWWWFARPRGRWERTKIFDFMNSAYSISWWVDAFFIFSEKTGPTQFVIVLRYPGSSLNQNKIL